MARSKLPGPRAYRGKGEMWDLKDQYLAWMVATNYAETSVKGSHADLSWFCRWLDKHEIDRAADVTPEVMEAFSISLREPQNGVVPRITYISHKLITLRSFFKWLTKQAVILIDPTEDMERPKLPKELPHTILSHEELHKMLGAPDLRSPIGYRDKAILELLYASGIRSGELLRLKVEDVDIPGSLIRIHMGKPRKDRTTPIPRLPMRYIQEYIEKVRPRFIKNAKKEHGILFINWTGFPMNINGLCEVMRRNTKLAGLTKRITALTFRHTIATHLLEAGMPIRHIQVFLSHERLETTTVYSKVQLSGLRTHFNRTHPKEQRPHHRRVEP